MNESSEKVLLLHHWDTDGVSSGAMIIQHVYKEIVTFTPSIGNYLLDEDDREAIRDIGPDRVVVVDMALPKDSVEFLKNFGMVQIFDHHLQKKHEVELHQNPIINGATQKEYPSTTWVVNEFLQREPDLLTILGAFGDREEKLKENELAMRTVDRVISDLFSDFDDLLECAELIDTLYKIGDREEIIKMPWFLSKVKEPEKILDRKDLKLNKKKLMEAIEKEIKGSLEKIGDSILYREMSSPYNIISTVARRLAWSRNDKTVVVSNSEYKKDACQIYVRGPLKDSESIINKMNKRDYSAGGKSDVIGMVIPEEDKEKVLEELVELL
ncbi:MAG: DHH family phosphoesterase [Candidatus Natronoplasma sp.]